MANLPILQAVVNITVPDINGNSIIKTFLNVTNLNFNYSTGMVKVVDATGSFDFTLKTITALTYTVVTGLAGSHTVTMS